jgi:isopentenyl diphosphate isomerase/L-lactate dehydrogenase-like FMN-dependent dehydrogenase
MTSRDSARARRWASVDEAQRSAARHLPSWLYAGLTMGNGSRVTSRANTASFDEVGFVPVAAVSVPRPDISTTILGRPVDLPVLCAPTGSTRIFHPGGDCAAARATATAGSIDVVAWDTGWSLEEIRAAAPDARLWQQIYWVRGRDGCEEVMVRAEKAGYEAIVMTLDVAVSPRAEVVLAPRRRSVPLPAFGPDLLWRYGPAAMVKPRWSTGLGRTTVGA